MFAGHIGAALAIGRAERRVNVGIFIGAALLLDFLLWLFVLAGWESASIPSDFARTHQAEFAFPYTHGLLASIAWSALAGVVVMWFQRLNQREWRCAALVGAAVFSHWLLDALVHKPELPLLGAGSPTVGFDLWQYMPVALAVEGLIVALGVALFISGASLSRAKKFGLTALCVLTYAFTVMGMTMAPPPPSVGAMAGGSLATLIVVVAIAHWLGANPHETRV